MCIAALFFGYDLYSRRRDVKKTRKHKSDETGEPYIVRNTLFLRRASPRIAKEQRMNMTRIASDIVAIFIINSIVIRSAPSTCRSDT